MEARTPSVVPPTRPGAFACWRVTPAAASAFLGRPVLGVHVPAPYEGDHRSRRPAGDARTGPGYDPGSMGRTRGRSALRATSASWMSLTAEGFGPRLHVQNASPLVVPGLVDGGERDGCWRRKLGAGQGGSHRAGLLWGRVSGHLHAWSDPRAPSPGGRLEQVRRGAEPLRSVVQRACLLGAPAGARGQGRRPDTGGGGCDLGDVGAAGSTGCFSPRRSPTTCPSRACATCGSTRRTSASCLLGRGGSTRSASRASWPGSCSVRCWHGVGWPRRSVATRCVACCTGRCRP